MAADNKRCQAEVETARAESLHHRAQSGILQSQKEKLLTQLTTLQHTNTATLQHTSAGTLQHTNTTTLQHTNTGATLQHTSAGTLQHTTAVRPSHASCVLVLRLVNVSSWCYCLHRMAEICVKCYWSWMLQNPSILHTRPLSTAFGN